MAESRHALDSESNAVHQDSSIADEIGSARSEALRSFKPEQIQSLGVEALIQVQELLGHGAEFGRWKTPKQWAASKSKSYRDINIEERIVSWIGNESDKVKSVLKTASSTALSGLLKEGVLTITRLAVTCRLVPSGNGFASNSPIRPPTICDAVMSNWPPVIARAICRKLALTPSCGELPGLLRYLTLEDVGEFSQMKQRSRELERIHTLVSRGQWCDAPARPRLEEVTDPSLAPLTSPTPRTPVPHPPLPDDWMSEIGPRLLWVVEELTPNLLALLEAIPHEMSRVDWAGDPKTISNHIQLLIAELLGEAPWLSRVGHPLVPAFPLKTSSSGKSQSLGGFEWPLRTWDQLQTLSIVAQTSHLMLVLLFTAGRIGEVNALTRDCVKISRSGKKSVRGFTYKLSRSLFGEEREWPAPPLLVQCLGQQARLAEAWSRLPENCTKGIPATPRYSPDQLWVSLGSQGLSEGELVINSALQYLADRLGVSRTPGGKAVHAHRFRKTIARLAGVALWNSPLVLRRIFGHRCIEMTLHYILSDPKIREETEAVLRELRVMHAAETIEEIHQSLTNALKPPSLGGQGGSRLVDAVVRESSRLARDGRVWDNGTAYDLATLLTINGTGWRLVRKDIVCAKAPGEPGSCKSQRWGQPDVSGCKPDCLQRVQLSSGKRDTEATIKQYIEIADKADEEGQILVLIAAFEGLQEHVNQYQDLADAYSSSYARLKHRIDAVQAE